MIYLLAWLPLFLYGSLLIACFYPKNIPHEKCSFWFYFQSLFGNFFVDQDTAREILKNAPGVVVMDDRTSNHFPTPLEVSNKDDVAVGRIRRDVSQEGNHG